MKPGHRRYEARFWFTFGFGLGTVWGGLGALLTFPGWTIMAWGGFYAVLTATNDYLARKDSKPS